MRTVPNLLRTARPPGGQIPRNWRLEGVVKVSARLFKGVNLP